MVFQCYLQANGSKGWSWTIRKVIVWGRGWGKGQKIHAEVGDLKKIVQRRSEEKKFLQNELHCQAYNLHLPEWQLGNHFLLQFNFVGPGVIPIHLGSSLRQMVIVPF